MLKLMKARLFARFAPGAARKRILDACDGDRAKEYRSVISVAEAIAINEALKRRTA
jgi:hypothetical protein